MPDGTLVRKKEFITIMIGGIFKSRWEESNENFICIYLNIITLKMRRHVTRPPFSNPQYGRPTLLGLEAFKKDKARHKRINLPSFQGMFYENRQLASNSRVNYPSRNQSSPPGNVSSSPATIFYVRT